MGREDRDRSLEEFVGAEGGGGADAPEDAGDADGTVDADAESEAAGSDVDGGAESGGLDPDD